MNKSRRNQSFETLQPDPQEGEGAVLRDPRYLHTQSWRHQTSTANTDCSKGGHWLLPNLQLWILSELGEHKPSGLSRGKTKLRGFLRAGSSLTCLLTCSGQFHRLDFHLESCPLVMSLQKKLLSWGVIPFNKQEIVSQSTARQLLQVGFFTLDEHRLIQVKPQCSKPWVPTPI